MIPCAPFIIFTDGFSCPVTISWLSTTSSGTIHPYLSLNMSRLSLWFLLSPQCVCLAHIQAQCRLWDMDGFFSIGGKSLPEPQVWDKWMWVEKKYLCCVREVKSVLGQTTKGVELSWETSSTRRGRDAGECGNWNGNTEPQRGAESSDPSHVNLSPEAPDPSWLKQPDSSCTLLVTSDIFSHGNPFLFLHINQDTMDTFSITTFSVSGFFFSCFCCFPEYQDWTTSPAVTHCLFKAWAHTQTQTQKTFPKNKAQHSQ